MTDFSQIIKILDSIINDRTIPKNIRKVAEDSKAALNSNDPLDLKISTAIFLLEEIINDPNMPIYARTKIWNIVSMLEEKKKEIS